MGDDAVRFLVTRAGDGPVPPGDCPEANALAAFAEGAPAEGGPGAEREPLERHISSCAECRALVVALARGSAAGAAPAEPLREFDAITALPGAATPPPGARGPVPGDRGPASEGFPRTVGDYTVLRSIGSGGMGVVYEAVHRQHGRHEALKVLKGGLGASPDLVERFHREVKALASLSHDHVVRVFDAGTLEGDLYYTMPLLPGSSLGDIARAVRATGETPPGARACEVLDRFGIPAAARAGLGPEQEYALRAAAALVGVADALAVMHERGILHRDIKPGNLLVDERGRVLLADFGLVRWGDQRITRTGQSMGTPAYMSPEQVVSDGRTPDGRTDLYALGATLFELLTLRLPHEGDTGLETVRLKLARRVAPVRTFNPAVPEDLETLIGRCLERRREDRVASAVLLRDELERFTRGEPVRVRPLSATARTLNALRRHRLPWGVAAAAVLAAAGWHFSRPTTLTVASIPPAQLFLDGKEIATTPLTAHRIAPGDHELRLVRDRFATFVRPFTLERGGNLEIDRSLQPLDPADPVALRALAASVGLQVPEVKVEVTRSSPGGVPLTLLFPRGRTLRAPPRVRLWVDDVADGWKLAMERAGEAGETLLSRELAATTDSRVDVALDDALRERLDAGGEFRLRLLDDSGRERDRCVFTVVDDATRERVAREWRSVTDRFPEGGGSLPFLEVYFLLSRGLHEEAYDRAVSLREVLGERREVAQAGLAVLKQAGLEDRGWWPLWVALDREAK